MGNDELKPAERLAVASLAVQLLPTGDSAFTDASDVTRAVNLAKQILEATDHPQKQRAYDLFGRDQALNAEEIASFFGEHDWSGLQSKNPVLRLIRTLLAALYRDIRIRQSLLEAALRQHKQGTDFPTTVAVATSRIKSLFGELGLDTAFGRNFDDASELLAYDLIEEGLKASRNLGKEIDNVRHFTPALFNEICLHSGYLEYAALRAPPLDLGLEKLADVILYLSGPLRERLHLDANAEDFFNELLTINPWPEYLCPHTQRKKTPFSECIAQFYRAPEDREVLIKLYDLGVRRFCSLWTGLQLAELRTHLTTDSLLAEVSAVRTKWTGLPSGEKGIISERSVEAPESIIRMVSKFLRGEAIPDLLELPWDGLSVRSPLFNSYLKSLVALFRAVEALNELGAEMDLTVNFHELEKLLQAEQTRVHELDLKMKDPDHLANATERGRRLVGEAASKKFDPGKIKPHLLFRYASERGLLEKELTR